MKSAADLKRPVGLRVIAVVCIGLWLACVSACSFPGLWCCLTPANEEGSCSGHQGSEAQVQSASTGHCDGSEGKSHRPNGDNSQERICCSAAKGFVQTSKPLVVQKVTFAPLFVLSQLEQPLNPKLIGAVISKVRDTIWLEWVLTPEMRTGPAIRSHAPPVFA